MTRFDNLQHFITTHFGKQPDTLEAITGDASFRRYFRLTINNQRFIVMDSDPQKVNNAPYLSLNQVFTDQGFLLPHIIKSDEQQGFFILTDLGSTHLADMLNDANRTDYYTQLISLSAKWAQTPEAPDMQAYGKDFIALELSIFSQWLVKEFIAENVDTNQLKMWESSCDLLTQTMLEQPTVTVHRDYHSRNIMHSDSQWAIIDYQDTVRGPLCYDLVSLLRDCYFKLPNNELAQLLVFGYNEFKREGLVSNTSFEEFKVWFDLTGLQRHLKAAGIFCRLYLRDGKTGYLANILPTLEYIVDVAERYPELNALSDWVKNTIVPKVTKRLEQVNL